MWRYAIFLRGINLGPRNKLLMRDLKTTLISLGYLHVSTYLQTGNICLDSLQNKESIANNISFELQRRYELQIEMVILTQEELQQIFARNPFPEETIQRSYFTFLSTDPKADLVEELSMKRIKNEEFHILGRCVYLHCLHGYGKAKCTNNYFEKKLELKATTRGYNTVKKILEISSKL
jgi:uncharacterized protein (DUF1697 family)